MATVVVTFFIKVRFYVCKMDADFKEKRSTPISTTRREKRWSMNSQRVEEIVAELMRPLGNLRQCFNTDLSSLLEEYLTEAGLRALDADNSDNELPMGELVPNFAELALLLQQSASIYGRKVDFLYQHVLSVSEKLHNSTIEIANTSNDNEAETDAAATPSTRRRRREAAAVADFTYIELQPAACARREPAPARPPPTLPRMYIELEPRVMGEGEAPLLDYAGEPIGLLTDFHVAWRIQNGLLVEELDGHEERPALRPIPLMELQAAIEANAPPSPPPLREDTPPPPQSADEPPDLDEHAVPHGASTPLPAGGDAPAAAEGDMPPPPAPAPDPALALAKKERKRKAHDNAEDFLGGKIRLIIGSELRLVLSQRREFDGARAWTRRVVEQRSRGLLLQRRLLRARGKALQQRFRGFDCSALDVSVGFLGWSGAEAARAAAAARLARDSARLSLSARRADDSDDDGFFEQSSLGDSDASRVDLHTPLPPSAAETERIEREKAEAAEWAAWRARVAARAGKPEGHAPLDVRALAERVISHLPERGQSKHFDAVLRDAAHEQGDVSRLFLATLFLANSGNVEVIQGDDPLKLNSFSLQLKSADPRLYSAAAAADPVTAVTAAACSADSVNDSGVSTSSGFLTPTPTPRHKHKGKGKKTKR